MSPYELPLRVLSKKKQKSNQLAGPTPVPNLDDVQPFMSVPDFVGKPGPELKALLTSQHFQNPYPYPGDTDVLPSYTAEPPDSAYSKILREHAKHALAHAWRYNPFRCSVKGAFQLSRDLAGKPSHGLTKDEFNWATGRKLRTVNKVRSIARVDVEQASNVYQWAKSVNECDDMNSLDGSEFDQELNKFYGPDGTDLRPIDECSDEGFFEPNPLSVTIVSLPEKSLMGEGITPGGIFQDSGISMDEGYAEYSSTHSIPHTAKETTGNVPGDWPSFSADVAPLRTPKKKGRWLGLVGDQKQCDWPGRCQGPYDLDGLRSSDNNRMVDGPSSATTHEHPLPAEIILPNESMQGAQEVSEPLRVEVNSEQPKDAARSFGPEQPPLPHDNKKEPIITQEIEKNEVSVGAAHSTSEERPHFLDGTIESGSDSEHSVSEPHVLSNGLQIDLNANPSTRRTRFSTPVNQRTGQFQQIRIDTPPTPETVEIHLTPEHNRDVDAIGGFDRSLEGRVPDSPTTGTQKGQSALDRYVQETERHTDLACQSSSAMSLDGSESEEDPLASAQKRPAPPEGHAGFSRAVKIQKKSDAVFTLGPPKALPKTPSPSKRAPIPITPAYVNDSPPFRPATPFQLATPTRPDLDSPGTPTPVQKASKKRKEKSVMNVFRSPKLGSRSPEHAPPTSEIVVVAPSSPPTTAGANDPHRGASSIGSRGLLFQKAETKNERGTKNVLGGLKRSPERQGGGGGGGGRRGSGAGSEREGPDEYEDELAGPAVKPPPRAIATGGSKVAGSAVVVPKVRSRDEMDDGWQGADVLGQDKPRGKKKKDEEEEKKKTRRSTATRRG